MHKRSTMARAQHQMSQLKFSYCTLTHVDQWRPHLKSDWNRPIALGHMDIVLRHFLVCRIYWDGAKFHTRTFTWTDETKIRWQYTVDEQTPTKSYSFFRTLVERHLARIRETKPNIKWLISYQAIFDQNIHNMCLTQRCRFLAHFIFSWNCASIIIWYAFCLRYQNMKTTL